MGLKRGSLIKVRAFGGKEIVRRFLAKRNGTILICSEEEYQSARLQKREPMCVGFPVADVIDANGLNPDHAEQSPRRNARRGRAN
jgi:hypothetical protein